MIEASTLNTFQKPQVSNIQIKASLWRDGWIAFVNASEALKIT
jgi:hypothetical protein